MGLKNLLGKLLKRDETRQREGRGTGKGKSKGKSVPKGPKRLQQNATSFDHLSYWLERVGSSAAVAVRSATKLNPYVQNAFAFVTMSLRKSKFLVGILPATLSSSGSLPTLLLSVVLTILLVGLTGSYLLFLHVKSDSNRIRELRTFRSKLRDKLVKLNCSPIMLRLAWSDCASFDKSIRQWPECGGATGSIRFDREVKCPANSGLIKAIDLLQQVKQEFKTVSWADAIQMAGALAVEVTGGPVVEMRYGRMDAPEVSGQSGASKQKAASAAKRQHAPLSLRLPSAVSPFPDNAPSADVHIRNTFYRMGFSNKDIVALCGAHTIGRAFKDRSGVCPFTSGDQGATIYTRPTSIAKGDGVSGIGMPGGCSWTKNWLQFDNSYFLHTDEADANLLWLPTDKALKECPEFKPHFIKYAKDEKAFFSDYASAHKRMSENGAKFSPSRGLTI